MAAAQRVARSSPGSPSGSAARLLGFSFTVLGLLFLIAAPARRLPGGGLSWSRSCWPPPAPAFTRQARREHDPTLVRLLMAALLLKLFGSLVRYWVAVAFYDSNADGAFEYHRVGVDLGHALPAGNFDTGLASLSGTDFISFFTGLTYTITGPSIFAGFLLYSWLAFGGMFYLYRAFTIAIPTGRKRSYARLLFFMPSMLYWPSSIGKEAWMLFTLGLAAFGTARVLTGRPWRGIALAGVAMWLAAIVRAHVSGMVVLGLVVAYLFARPPRRLGALGPAVKMIALAALVVVAVGLLGRTQSYLLEKGIDPRTASPGCWPRPAAGPTRAAPASRPPRPGCPSPSCPSPRSRSCSGRSCSRSTTPRRPSPPWRAPCCSASSWPGAGPSGTPSGTCAGTRTWPSSWSTRPCSWSRSPASATSASWPASAPSSCLSSWSCWPSRPAGPGRPRPRPRARDRRVDADRQSSRVRPSRRPCSPAGS